MRLKEYLENNEYAKVNINIHDNGLVVIEVALVDEKRNKKYSLAEMENSTLQIGSKTLEGLSEFLIRIALKKIDKELNEKELAHLEKITKRIESGVKDE